MAGEAWGLEIGLHLGLTGTYGLCTSTSSDFRSQPGFSGPRSSRIREPDDSNLFFFCHDRYTEFPAAAVCSCIDVRWKHRMQFAVDDLGAMATTEDR